MNKLLKFLIRKKASVVYRVQNEACFEKVIKMIMEQTSKQKPIVSRIIDASIKEKFPDRIFQSIKPEYGYYCIGDAGCNLYIRQSVNHCILLPYQYVYMSLFDVTAVIDENFNVSEILYGDEKISRSYIPEELLNHLSAITKTASRSLMKQFFDLENEILKGSSTIVDEFIACLAKNGVNVTFVSNSGNKPTSNVIDYLAATNANILTLSKNDNSHFVGTDFSLITEFYAKRLISGDEMSDRKIAVPLFGVKNYKNIPKSAKFIYAGYSDNNKYVPNNAAVITVSDGKPVKFSADGVDMDLCEDKIMPKGDINVFLEKYNIILSKNLTDVLKMPS